MLRYETEANVTISIDLQNGYTVIAMARWDNEKKNYYTTLRLRDNTVEKWDLIEEAANVIMESDMKSIKRDMAQYVTKLLTTGFFKKYIDRYEYELKCFDKGLETIEAEAEKASDIDDFIKNWTTCKFEEDDCDEIPSCIHCDNYDECLNKANDAACGHEAFRDCIVGCGYDSMEDFWECNGI